MSTILTLKVLANVLNSASVFWRKKQQCTLVKKKVKNKINLEKTFYIDGPLQAGRAIHPTRQFCRNLSFGRVFSRHEPSPFFSPLPLSSRKTRARFFFSNVIVPLFLFSLSLSLSFWYRRSLWARLAYCRILQEDFLEFSLHCS